MIHLALIVLAGVIVYSNTFGAPFQFDDFMNITDNPLVRDPSNIPSFFLGGEGPFASRPLLHATVALNYYFGGFDTRGYHAVNLAIHLLNGALLYLLVVMTGRRLGHIEEDVRLAGLVASLIFVVHPVQTEAVTNIVNRSMLLATVFYLAGLILFLKAVTSEQRRGLYIAGLLAVSLLGAASREDFSTFPVMLFLYDLLFISRFRLFNRKISPSFVTPPSPLKVRGARGVMPFSDNEAAGETVAGHWRAYLPAVAALGYSVFLIVENTYTESPGRLGWGIPPSEYVLTQFSVHWTYVRLLVLPVNQNLIHDYPVARALSEPLTLLAFIGYLGLWAGAVLLARRRPVISYGALWFLAALLPISFGVALTGLMLDNVIFEHRAYLSSAGVFVAAASGLAALAGRGGNSRRGAVALLVVIVVVFSAAAYARNAVWRSEISLWEDVAAKSPDNPYAHGNLGTAYYSAGRHAEAVEQFRLQMGLHRGMGRHGHVPADRPPARP